METKCAKCETPMMLFGNVADLPGGSSCVKCGGVGVPIKREVLREYAPKGGAK